MGLGDPAQNPGRLFCRFGRGSERRNLSKNPGNFKEQLYAQMPLGKGVTRTAFEISLEALCQVFGLEGGVELDLPRGEFRGMEALARIVICQPLFQVCSM